MTSFFMIGLSIALLLNTILSFLETRLLGPLSARLGGRFERLVRPLALFLSALTAISALFAVVFMILPEVARTFVVLGEQAPQFLEGATAWITDMADGYGRSLAEWNMPQLDWVKVGDALLAWLQDAAESLLSGTFIMASSIFSGVFNGVIGFVVAVYILSQKERLSGQARRALYAYLPAKRVDRLLEIGRLAQRIFCSFISGQFLEAMILGGLCFLGMRVLSFPFAPTISVLVGVMAFLPIFGGLVGSVIGSFMILVNRGGIEALGFLLFLFALQQIEGNLIYPHVVGKRVALPGLWVLTAVTLGGNAMGIPGMLVSVPIASLLYALLREAVKGRTRAVDGER